jgi:hypothetical protein
MRVKSCCPGLLPPANETKSSNCQGCQLHIWQLKQLQWESLNGKTQSQKAKSCGFGSESKTCKEREREVGLVYFEK